MKPRRAKTVTTRQRQAAFYESRPLKLTGSGQYADMEERAFWAHSARQGRAQIAEIERGMKSTMIGAGVICLGAAIVYKLTGGGQK